MIRRSDPARASRSRSHFDAGLHSDLLFEGTGLILTVDALIVLGAIRALGSGPDAWLRFLANMSSPVGRGASGLFLLCTLAFSVRWLLGAPVDHSASAIATPARGGRVPGLERLEPLLAGLFRVGGAVAAGVLPGLMFILTIAAPMGWLSGASGERGSGQALRVLGSSLALELACAGLISLTLWHAAHHLRLLMLDLGLHQIRTPIAYLLYGLALGGTLASLEAVLSLSGGV